MAPSLTRLHGERGTCKAVLTNIQKYMDVTALEDITEEDLKSRLKSLNRAAEKFELIQNKIYDLLNDDEKDHAYEQLEVTEFEEKVVNLEARIERMLKMFIVLPSHPTTSQGPSTTDADLSRMATAITQAVKDGQSQRSHIVKLPQLTIPKFSGKYTDWQSFKDLYKSCIHNNADLSAAQKFSYLKSYLEGGEAESVIKHLAPSDNNYNDAWKLLERRFDKKQCILFSHIDMFFSQECVPDNNPSALRSHLNSTLESINAVDALGHKERDVWLINFILRKVDKETHTLWTREFAQTEVPSWDDFQDFLERRCDSVEATTSHCSDTLQQEKPNVKAKTFVAPKPHRTSLIVSLQDCSMCQQGIHPSFYCPRFVSSTPAQRLKMAKEFGLCFNCLRNTHTMEVCQSSNCRRCQMKHNTMLHEALSILPEGYQVAPATSARPVITVTPVTPAVTPVTPSVTPVTPSVTPVTPRVTPVTPAVTPVTSAVTSVTPAVTPVTPAVTPVTPAVTSVTSTVTPVTPRVTPVTSAVTPVTPAFPGTQFSWETAPSHLISNSKHGAMSRQILLPTAIIVVRGGDGRLHKGRALIDSCSQSNFVTASFAQKCKLPIFTEDNEIISGIGQNTTTVNGSTCFTFTSQDGQFTMTQDFMIMDNIVNDQPSSTFEAFGHIPMRIPLADVKYNIRAKVDIILGAEVFIRCLRSGRIEGSPILQQTAFGYIIAGKVPCNSLAMSKGSCIATTSTCYLSSFNDVGSLHLQNEQLAENTMTDAGCKEVVQTLSMTRSRGTRFKTLQDEQIYRGSSFDTTSGRFQENVQNQGVFPGEYGDTSPWVFGNF